jgi:hypothetical protein
MAKREPLLMHLYRESGFREGTRAAEFIVSWGLYVDSGDVRPVGALPSMEDYSRYWKQSLATSYRGLRAFHESFPDEHYPDRIWGRIADKIEARKVARASREAMFVEGVWR